MHTRSTASHAQLSAGFVACRVVVNVFVELVADVVQPVSGALLHCWNVSTTRRECIYGYQVELVKRDHRQDGTESVTQAIIKKRLTSGAAPTCTYQHLIECLRQSELGALAEDIANITAGEGMSPTISCMHS